MTKLSAMWRASGVCASDVLLVHASSKRTLKEHGATPTELLESFLNAVGPSGTLLFPTFNFGWCRGAPFDIRSTPSEMGILSETARKHPSAIRTGHPVYSFAVIGAQAHEFDGLCNSSGYGSDSPFSMLRAMYGKIAVLDLPDQNSMTMYHHVEEMCGAPWRYHKRFAGGYTDKAGVTTDRVFGIFVRELGRNIQTHVDPMGERLWAAGLYHGERPGIGAGLRIIDADDLYWATLRAINRGEAYGLLYLEGAGS